MGMPGRINQQTNTLDIIVRYTNDHPVGVDDRSQHCLYRRDVEFSHLSIARLDLGQMANLKLVDKRVKELVELKLQLFVEVRMSSG